MYYGAFAIDGIVGEKQFILVSTQQIIVRLFCENHIDEDTLAYVEQLCRKFVMNFANFYGQQYVSHNVHNLTYLVDDVRIRYICIPITFWTWNKILKCDSMIVENFGQVT